MQYNSLGKAGIKVSEFSFGSWITFGKQIDLKLAKELMHYAFDQGVNCFDNAEAYAHGESEIIMGNALKDFLRKDLVITTKIFWGGNGPNDTGLSRKHLIEGTKNSLKRLQLDYVDLLFCHRPDPTTPIEETVLAMDYLVRQGFVLYWGTSEWPQEKIEKAFQLAKEMHCIPPTMEQPQYNLFSRDRVEKEYLSLYKNYGLGSTTWSPLASGLLSGKYDKGIPKDSRLGRESWLINSDMEARIQQVKRLKPIAQEIGCTLAQLALAWCLKNPNVSTVIVGASKLDQLRENLRAAEFKLQLTPDILKRIDECLA